MHLIRVPAEDLGRPYSHMVSRLLLAFGWVCLGLRREHLSARGLGWQRRSSAANMRSMLGLGAAARAAEAALAGGKQKEVRGLVPIM